MHSIKKGKLDLFKPFNYAINAIACSNKCMVNVMYKSRLCDCFCRSPIINFRSYLLLLISHYRFIFWNVKVVKINICSVHIKNFTLNTWVRCQLSNLIKY